MTTDWEAIARARGVAAEHAGMIARLEAAFRPLAGSIPDDVEPAIIFHVEDDER
jgi:hypothetical protein